MLNAEEIVSKLISFQTVAPKGDEGECSKFLLDYLKDLKVDDSEIDIQEFGGSRANVIATFGTKKEPGLLLSGHMDVVPTDNIKLWHSDPFTAVVKGSRLYGRGASDMKGGIASMLKAVEDLVKNQALKRKLMFVATAGEETGFVGLKKLVNDSIITSGTSKYVVIGEPTDLRPARAHRGIYRIKVSFIGQSSHASTPELGVNAIELACKFVNELENSRIELAKNKDDLLGLTTLTPTLIDGGIGENVVPSIASVVVDSRRIPFHSSEFIRSKIESTCSNLKVEFSIAEIVNEVPLNTPEGNFLTQLAEDASGIRSGSCAFGTEGSVYWGKLGLPTIVIGPGSVQQAHVVDEYVELSQIKRAVSIYTELVRKICL